MKMKKFLVLTATVAMVASMAVGCGNSGNSDKTDGKAETEFDAANDISVVSREDGSGTRGAFIELFGIEEKDASGEKVDNTTEEANITNSTSVMLSTVADNEYAIGYVSLGSLNDTVKALKVDGAEPTEENIKSGEYKVARPFNIATKGDVSEVAQDFINFILSTEGQAVVSESGYIALDNVQAYAGSKSAGKVSLAGLSSITPGMEKLKEAYLKVNPSAEIEIQESDSTTGMTSVADGICDIGMASREVKEEELAKGLKATVIATDGIAVIVNKANTLDDITSDQVKSVYTGETTTWEDLAK